MKNITNDQCKDTGLAIILILLIATWAGKNVSLVGPTIIVLVIIMTCPKLFTPLAKLWFGLANLMSAVASKVVLTIVFFLVVTPIGLLRKAMGKDAMAMKSWKAGNASAFIDRQHKCTAADLEKPF